MDNNYEEGRPIVVPDSYKLAVDIQHYLKNNEVTQDSKLKEFVIRLCKELENMFLVHKELTPYFRKELVELRHAVRHEGDEIIKEKSDIVRERLERVRARQESILKRAIESKENKQKLFFACIDEGIRIAVIDKLINVASKLHEGKNLKKLVLQVQRSLKSANVTPKNKKILMDAMCETIRMLAVDGMTALKLASDMADLKDLVARGKPVEAELEAKLKLVKTKVEKLSNEACTRRDEIEKALLDVNRTMHYLDKQVEISEKNQTEFEFTTEDEEEVQTGVH